LLPIAEAKKGFALFHSVGMNFGKCSLIVTVVAQGGSRRHRLRKGKGRSSMTIRYHVTRQGDEWRAVCPALRRHRFIGIDYSGAETPTASLKGLRVYLAEGDASPVEVPPPSLRKYWTRKGIAEWLVERLAEDAPTLVGIDHGFSFPLRYFEVHRLKPDWPNASPTQATAHSS
jgi:hypothetical protein